MKIWLYNLSVTLFKFIGHIITIMADIQLVKNGIISFYFMHQVWTPNVVTVWEALLTVLQFGLLLMHAYAQDKRWPYLSLPLYAILLLFLFIVLAIEVLYCLICFLFLLSTCRARSERPEDWVPEEAASCKDENNVYDGYAGICQDGEMNLGTLLIFFLLIP